MGRGGGVVGDDGWYQNIWGTYYLNSIAVVEDGVRQMVCALPSQAKWKEIHDQLMVSNYYHTLSFVAFIDPPAIICTIMGTSPIGFELYRDCFYTLFMNPPVPHLCFSLSSTIPHFPLQHEYGLDLTSSHFITSKDSSKGWGTS